VDETRHGGGVGEGIVTALVENGFGDRILVSSRDSYVPLAATPRRRYCSVRTTSSARSAAVELTDRALITR
jgi:hypothetical protein